MLVSQRITGPIVVEARGGAPLAGIVALGAVVPQAAPVDVLMATDAAAVQPHELRLTGGQPGGWRYLKLPGMTVATSLAGMTLEQGPPGPAVIETVPASIGPLDQMEIGAGVVRVTGCAGLTPYLSPGVVALLLTIEPGNVLVATQTIGVHRFLATAVALGALQGSIQLGVRLCQGPGGDLPQQLLIRRVPHRSEHRYHHQEGGEVFHGLPEPGRTHCHDDSDMHHDRHQRCNGKRPVSHVPEAKQPLSG